MMTTMTAMPLTICHNRNHTSNNDNSNNNDNGNDNQNNNSYSDNNNNKSNNNNKHNDNNHNIKIANHKQQLLTEIFKQHQAIEQQHKPDKTTKTTIDCCLEIPINHNNNNNNNNNNNDNNNQQ